MSKYLNKFRLTIIREGEEVWSREVKLEGLGVFVIGFHILNSIFSGGEIVLKPNRPIPKADMEFFEEMERRAEAGSD